MGFDRLSAKHLNGGFQKKPTPMRIVIQALQLFCLSSFLVWTFSAYAQSADQMTLVELGRAQVDRKVESCRAALTPLVPMELDVERIKELQINLTDLQASLQYFGNWPTLVCAQKEMAGLVWSLVRNHAVESSAASEPLAPSWEAAGLALVLPSSADLQAEQRYKQLNAKQRSYLRTLFEGKVVSLESVSNWPALEASLQPPTPPAAVPSPMFETSQDIQALSQTQSQR